MKSLVTGVVPLLLIGCATMNTERNGKGNGTAVVYQTSMEKAYECAKIILREAGATISREDEEKGIVRRN